MLSALMLSILNCVLLCIIDVYAVMHTQYYYPACQNAQCHSDLFIVSIIMLRSTMLILGRLSQQRDILLSCGLLSVIVLSVVILNVVRWSVMAPKKMFFACK
jgi:hypothetical protein